MSALPILKRDDGTPVTAGSIAKVLLVDDVHENLVALDGLLRRQDVELVHAHSGRDALELLLVHEFALAIIDVQMPIMSGFELAELMRGAARTRKVPIIFITAGAQNQQHLFRGYEAGAVDFLFKPVQPEVLRSKVAVFIELDRTRLEIARQRDELLRTHNSLIASEKLARTILEGVGDAVVVLDSSGRITRANVASRQFATRDMLLAPFEEVFQVKSATLPVRAITACFLQAVQRGESVRGMEAVIQRGDGTKASVLLSASPLSSADQAPVGCVVTLTDITARMQSEEALRTSERGFNAIANLVPDLLWRADQFGQPNWYNQGWYDYTGQTRQQSEGAGWVNAIHPEDREHSQAAAAEAVRKGEAVRVEHRLRGADGRYRWFLAQSRPFHDENGKINAWFGAATDIQEERMASNALKKSLAEKEELLKEVHHRVKNNLQIITSLLNLQARKIEDREMLALFNVALNRVQSIASIHELIYRSGSFTAVDFGVYVRTLAADFIRLYGAQDRIEVNVIGEGASLELERAVPLGLLLSELLSNVCKHAFPHGARGSLTVQIHRSEDHLDMAVIDTGVGLSADFNYKKTSSLGIFLVHRLARQLRATVACTSGNGTSVHVRMPVTNSEEWEEDNEGLA